MCSTAAARGTGPQEISPARGRLTTNRPYAEASRIATGVVPALPSFQKEVRGLEMMAPAIGGQPLSTMIRLHARPGKTVRPVYIVARIGIACCAMVQISANYKLSVGADASQARASTSGRDALRSRMAARAAAHCSAAIRMRGVLPQRRMFGATSLCRVIVSVYGGHGGASHGRGTGRGSFSSLRLTQQDGRPEMCGRWRFIETNGGKLARPVASSLRSGGTAYRN